MLKSTGQFATKAIPKIIRRLPINSSTEIRITRLCTQRCRQCSVYERTTNPPSMDIDSFKVIAKRLREYGAYIGFISGGEATLVQDLDKILLEAKQTFSQATTLVTGLYNQTSVIEKAASVALDNDINIQTSLDGFGEIGDYLRGAKNFSDTVLKHMKLISEKRGHSKSLLYANIVLNNLNLEQVPELIQRAVDLGWKTTIGVYHTLTETTRYDEELKLRPGKKLDDILSFLDANHNILNLNSYILGINDFINGQVTKYCAFTDSPSLATRVTIMEDGDVYLCYGGAIGNLYHQSLFDIFTSESYKQALELYSRCRGCWTTCYTQRYLLIHPRSIHELLDNIRKVLNLKR
ncbi:radical SAM protein [candidate division KSB1 bacterium]|nr:radical SAM protein [candidate division KSB1 bacterium]